MNKDPNFPYQPYTLMVKLFNWGPFFIGWFRVLFKSTIFFQTNVPERIKATPHSGVLRMGEEREITISLARNADLTDLRKRGSDKVWDEKDN